MTYANIVSTLALFVALGGGAAFAATQLAPKSVGEKQLRPGAVTADKLRKNAVTAAKIKALAVKQGKLANGSVTAAKVATAAVSTRALQGGSVTTDKIADDAVTGDKVAEGTLSQVPSAAKADFASAAESANPVAFAHVTAEAGIDISNSKGIVPGNVKEGSLPGIYCLTAPGFNPRGAQVTPQFEGGGTITPYVKIGGTSDCPAPQVEVQIFESGARAKKGFYIALYR